MNAFLGVTRDDVTAGLVREINEDLSQNHNASVEYRSADITLVGVARQDDIWTLNINGLDLKPSYKVPSGGSLNDIASNFRTLAATVTGMTVGGSGATIQLSRAALFSVSVSAQSTGIALHNNTNYGTGSAIITPHTGEYSYVVVEGSAFELKNIEPYLNAHVALSGTPVAGQNWTLILNGTPYLYKVKFGDHLSDVATALATMVENADYFGATVTGNGFDVTSTAFFTAKFVITGTSSNSGAGTITGAPALVTYDSASVAAWTSATVSLTGPTQIGNVWVITLNGQEYSYTVKDVSGSP